MRISCPAQLRLLQLGVKLQPVYVVLTRRWRHRTLQLAARAKNDQKNDGVYFEYEAVDPDAANQLADLQEGDKDAFTWARRSREQKNLARERFRKIDSKAFRVVDAELRGRREGKRRSQPKGLTPGEKREAAKAAAAAAADTTVLPSFSPVQTPAMQPRAVTPEGLVSRPRVTPTTPPGQRFSPAPAQLTTTTAAMVPGMVDEAGQGAAAEAANSGCGSPTASARVAAHGTGEEGSDDASAGTGSEGVLPAAPSGTASSSGMTPAGGGRRQRLLERIKGGGSATASATSAAQVTAGAAASTAAPSEAASQAQPWSQSSAAGGFGGTTTGSTAATTGAVVAAAVGGTPPLSVDGGVPQEPASLADQLPEAGQLPFDAQPAHALLESILSPSDEEVRQVTQGDVGEMLQRDMDAAQEFRQWLQRASASSAGKGSDWKSRQSQGPSGATGAGAEAASASELTEAEIADLEAALANLDLEDLEADLELEKLLTAEVPGTDGDEELGKAAREVSELQGLMAELDTAETASGSTGSGADLTDEQVLSALKAQDPALYELLKDVPEFDKLDLDLDLDVDLDADQLSEAEMAELAAEAVGLRTSGDAAGGGGDEEEGLAALLRDMRGMGLIQEDGAADGDDDDKAGGNEDDDDDDEGELALGDLLEALEEDDGLDPQARVRAQFALQSMFNQPADELAAKGSRGGAAPALAPGPLGSVPAEPPLPPQLRGTTGMARGALSADDEDGGAAPPPMLPRPKPKPRS